MGGKGHIPRWMQLEDAFIWIALCLRTWALWLDSSFQLSSFETPQGHMHAIEVDHDSFCTGIYIYIHSDFLIPGFCQITTKDPGDMGDKSHVAKQRGRDKLGEWE